METKTEAPPPLDELARELYEAETAARAVSPLTSRFPALTPADAYGIQDAYAARRAAAGASLVGRKIGCTSTAIQELFGIDTPDYGRIFDDMVIENGGTAMAAELIAPMAEMELAFRLRAELRGPGVTRDDVLAATEAVIPCIEVIDSRIADWQIGFVDTVADNGSSARCVFGHEHTLAGLDLAAVEGVLRVNGEEVARGRANAVLGHPAEGVAWLANSVADYGHALHAGEYVLSGAFTTAIRIHAGDQVVASFAGLGDVSLRID